MIEDYIVFLKEDATLQHELDNLKAFKVKVNTYNFEKTKAIDKLIFLYAYSGYINFKETNPYIEKSHNLNNRNHSSIVNISTSQNNLTLGSFIKELKNKTVDYSQYLMIDEEFKFKIINTSELVKIPVDNNSYFSKPLLLLLENKYGIDSPVALEKININNSIINTIKISITGKSGETDDYDISYNPPNGNPSK